MRAPPISRGRLFRRYVALIAGAMAMVLVANSALDIWLSYREQEALLILIQRAQADAAAAKIAQFVREIETQMAWTAHLSWGAGTHVQRRLEAVRLLRQVPSMTDGALLYETGREQIKISRLSKDVIGSQIDRSHEPAFGGPSPANPITAQCIFGTDPSRI